MWSLAIYAEAVIVNHNVLLGANSYAKPVDVNHGVLFCGSQCDSWWGFLTQLWTIVSYAEAVGVNHGVFAELIV